MKQCYISPSLEGLDFRKRYGLTDYVDSLSPLIVFGMYREEDFVVLDYYRQPVTVVWQGMDAKDIPYSWLPTLRRTNIKHIAISHWISESLNKYGIEHTYLPVSATIDNPNPCKRGDHIFMYYSDDSPTSRAYYNADSIPFIEKNTGLKVLTARHGEYDRETLQKIYQECFINLRLTTYDGCPNTNLEMGLMGRRSIFNGHIPHSVPWRDLHDICDTIMSEYKARHQPNERIANDISRFLNIPFP